MLIALRKGYRDLTRRRLRSFLTVVGIVIGVAGIVSITSTSKNMAAAYNFQHTEARLRHRPRQPKL